MYKKYNMIMTTTVMFMIAKVINILMPESL